jgi:MFS family permease
MSFETASTMKEDDPQRRFKFVVLFFLYVAPYVPMFFFPIVFPVMLRQSGAPLERIGLYGFFAIPVVLKFLWAPLVDRFGNKKFGHYKIWIIATQVSCATIGSAMAFLSFADQFWWIMGLGMLFVVSLSTQWIAVNGLAILSLSEEDRPRGNSLASVGMAVGTLSGGSLMLLVGTIGYPSTMLLAQSLLVVATILLLFFRELDHPIVVRTVNLFSSFEAFKSPSLRRWLFLINLCIIGDALLTSMVGPMLVDKGLSTDKIGLMLGTIRPLFAIMGAIVCTPLIKRFSRKTNLISFGLFNAITLGLFIFPALNLTGEHFLYVVFATAGAANSFKRTLIYSVFMDHSRRSHAATDFALQVSVLSIGATLYEVSSGFLAAWFGYASLFMLSVALDFIGLVFIGFFYRDAAVERHSEQIGDTVVLQKAL